MIKSQRESGDKAAAAAAAAQAAGNALAEAAAQANQPGGIEVSILHKDAPRPVTITFDDGTAETFHGPIWSRNKVSPGMYKIAIATLDTVPIVMSKIVSVKAAAITTVEFKLER
jgi:hypothetical protein